MKILVCGARPAPFLIDQRSSRSDRESVPQLRWAWQAAAQMSRSQVRRRAKATIRTHTARPLQPSTVHSSRSAAAMLRPHLLTQ